MWKFALTLAAVGLVAIAAIYGPKRGSTHLAEGKSSSGHPEPERPMNKEMQDLLKKHADDRWRKLLKNR